MTSKPILEMDLSDLRQLTSQDIRRFLTQEEISHIFRTCDALWLHSGDPKAPHAELTSGKCSDGFVDVLRVLRYANLCEIMAAQLVHLLDRFPSEDIDWVIGSDHAGATLSFAVAAQLHAQHDFTEKGEGKSQLWRRFTIEPGQVVLQVEELITTTSTLQAVREGVRSGNPSQVTFASLVLTLVDRSSIDEFDGSTIVSLVHYDIQTWDPSDCPLCAAGSQRVRPKQNWDKLTGH